MTTLAEQQYNGLHWRTVVRRDTDLPVDGIDQMRVLSYDASWRLVDDLVDDAWTSGFTADRTLEQFWGLRYIDDPILRRPDPEAVGGYWHVTDVQFSTMALLDNNAAVYERVWYTPYGEARHHWGQDYDGDRGFSTADGDALIAYLLLHGSSTPIDDDDYVVEMDYNRDGAITFDDYPSGSGQTAVPLGQISDLDATSGPDNWIGYAGYVWEGASSLYHVRFRSYSPSLGRWMQRDPAGYVDGSNLFGYCSENPPAFLDPFGLEKRKQWKDDEERERAICDALKDAKENGMDLREFVRKYSPTWGSSPGLLFNLEYDVDGYGNVDIDWMLTLILAHYDGFAAERYWLDPLRGADPEFIYGIGKRAWIVIDAVRDENVDFDPSRFGHDNEWAAVNAARDLLDGKMTLEEFFGIDCSKYEDCDSEDDVESVDTREEDETSRRRGRRNRNRDHDPWRHVDREPIETRPPWRIR